MIISKFRFAQYDPKRLRGLSFRDLKAFNTSLLAKQGWRYYMVITRCFNLCSKLVVFLIVLGSSYSYYWKSIMYAQNLLKKGDGTTTLANSPWITEGNKFKKSIESRSLALTTALSIPCVPRLLHTILRCPSLVCIL